MTALEKILKIKPPSSITDVEVIKYPIEYVGGFYDCWVWDAIGLEQLSDQELKNLVSLLELKI